MFDVLNSYLFQHKSISVPGLGTIFLERAPAEAGNGSFTPPQYYFRFDKYFDAPGKDFFSFLAAEKNIPDYEAIKWYNEFSFDLRNKIRQEEKVKWDDVGVLTKDDAGNIIFESDPENPLYFKPAPANIVIRKDAQHALLVGDRETSNAAMKEWLNQPETETAKKETWWIYALILAAAALIVLLFHFSSNGWQSSSSGNQQKLETSK